MPMIQLSQIHMQFQLHIVISVVTIGLLPAAAVFDASYKNSDRVSKDVSKPFQHGLDSIETLIYSNSSQPSLGPPRLYNHIKSLWDKIQSIEGNVHIAEIDPKSGPMGGARGFNFDLSPLENTPMNDELVHGTDQLVPRWFVQSLVHPTVTLVSSLFPSDTTVPSSNSTVTSILGSSLPTPKLIVHVDLIGGADLWLAPEVISETLLKVTVPLETIDGVPPTMRSPLELIGNEGVLKASLSPAKRPAEINMVSSSLNVDVPDDPISSSLHYLKEANSVKKGRERQLTDKNPELKEMVKSDDHLKFGVTIPWPQKDRLLVEQSPQAVPKMNTVAGLAKVRNTTVEEFPRPSHRLAMISLHFFPNVILSEERPQIFRIYPTPKITHVLPRNLSLAGNEGVYLFGHHLFASDVIKVRFTSVTSDKSKIQDCEFIMATRSSAFIGSEMRMKPVQSNILGLPAESNSIPSSSLPRILEEVHHQESLQLEDTVSEVPAILCISPQWTTDDNVVVSLSFNGQQYHRATQSDQQPVVIAYADRSSLLDSVVKGVVEREKGQEEDRGKNHSGMTLHAADNKENGLENVVSGKEHDDASKNMQMLRVVDEAQSRLHNAESEGYNRAGNLLDQENEGGRITSVGEVAPVVAKSKHLPNYREKPKDLLAIHLEDSEKNVYVLSRPSDLQKIRYDFRLVADIATLITAAAIGGFIAETFKCPVVLGHLIGGVVVGPQCLSRIQQLIQVVSVAQMGSAFLLFELGLHFSVKRVIKVRQAALCIGIFGHLCFLGVFILFALIQRTSLSEAFVLGCFITMSSTAICSKYIAARRASETHEADVTIGVLLVQDISLGLMLALLPAISIHGRSMSLLGLAARIFAPFLSITILALFTLVISVLILPRFLSHLHRRRSREILLLCCLAAMLIMGLLAECLDLPFELGAFTCGLAIGCQPLVIRNEVDSIVASLKDVYAALFFAVIGVVLDPLFVWDNLNEILSVLAMATALKSIFRLSRYDWRTSLRVALMLSHVGEFGFVILERAVVIGLLGRKVHLLLLGTTGISLVLTPFFLKLVVLIPTGPNLHVPPSLPPSIDLLWCVRGRTLSTIITLYRYYINILATQPFSLWLLKIGQYLATADYAALPTKDDHSHREREERNTISTMPSSRRYAKDVEIGGTFKTSEHQALVGLELNYREGNNTSQLEECGAYPGLQQSSSTIQIGTDSLMTESCLRSALESTNYSNHYGSRPTSSITETEEWHPTSCNNDSSETFHTIHPPH